MKDLPVAPLFVATFSTVALGLLLTAPEECRTGRWAKIMVSIPAALVITQSFAVIEWGYFGIFMGLFLAQIWKDNIAWVFASVVANVITKASDSIIPDFRRAKLEARDGNLVKALKLAEQELNKDPNDVEGLLFVAELLIVDQQFEKARAALDRVVFSNSATAAQIIRAKQASAEVEEILVGRMQFAQQVS